MCKCGKKDAERKAKREAEEKWFQEKLERRKTELVAHLREVIAQPPSSDLEFVQKLQSVTAAYLDVNYLASRR